MLPPSAINILFYFIFIGMDYDVCCKFCMMVTGHFAQVIHLYIESINNWINNLWTVARIHPDGSSLICHNLRQLLTWADCHRGGVIEEVSWVFIDTCWMVTNWSSLDTWLWTIRQINVQADLKHVNDALKYQTHMKQCTIWNSSVSRQCD
jgi:hypothetical protein